MVPLQPLRLCVDGILVKSGVVVLYLFGKAPGPYTLATDTSPLVASQPCFQIPVLPTALLRGKDMGARWKV